ncbi:uncharacterized protein M421DRAFT_207613 [Didymella exigua CBS 183.55]|uniref:Uncharacterized protein n=1 Tax=Didymella exigua CBS 183.55 TaxID=1150837 RepID=A0A6A5RIA6_9PLEO|nr:uncharacterized protein M421DRAFT_207613 [Didymella exigua CBS 183.55]KAF1926824.1 hypothetical protein M421DRAFT_207613 [Didymella exigua CBS 183.55]
MFKNAYGRQRVLALRCNNASASSVDARRSEGGKYICSVALPSEEALANKRCPRSEQEGKGASSLAGAFAAQKYRDTPRRAPVLYIYPRYPLLCLSFALQLILQNC